jgi:ribonuclease HI
MSPGSIHSFFNQELLQQQPPQNEAEIHIDTNMENQKNISKHLEINPLQLQQLCDIQEKLKGQTELIAYTDGSLSYYQEQGFMGIGWKIIDQTNKEYTFQAQTENFPSSTKAELSAIALVLMVMPSFSSVNIYTDSQTAITAITKSNNYNPTKIMRKYTNWLILNKIQEITQQKHININLVKVQAHSGITHNEEVDKLAKIDLSSGMRPNTRIINIKASNNKQNTIHATWEGTTIDRPIKDFYKTVMQAKRLAQWRLLNRNLIWINKQTVDNTNWKITYICLYPSKINNGITSFEDSNQRKFNLNLWNDELPTKSKLFKRMPLIYQDNKCIKCGEIETSIHPFTCSTQIDNTRVQIYKIIIETIGPHIKKEFKNNLTHIINKDLNLKYDHILRNFIRGAVDQKTCDIIKTITDKTQHTHTHIQKILQKTKKYLRHIWSIRCEEFLQWEKTKGITKQIKRKGKFSKTPTDPLENDQEKIRKDQYINLVNKWVTKYIKGNTQIFSILKLNFSTD